MMAISSFSEGFQDLKLTLQIQSTATVFTALQQHIQKRNESISTVAFDLGRYLERATRQCLNRI